MFKTYQVLSEIEHTCNGQSTLAVIGRGHSPMLGTLNTCCPEPGIAVV